MKRLLLICLLAGANITLHSQDYVAGYEVAKDSILRTIPDSILEKVRNDLHIAYQHTSHGTHVSHGLYGLPDFKSGDDTLFAISNSQEAGKLEFRDYALESYAPPGIDAADLSRDETAFIQTTRNYLDASENADINVIMWSWCNIAGHDVTGNYLPGMDSLIREYGPGGTKIGVGAGQREKSVNFVFMTGHANAGVNTGPLNPVEQADTIVKYCKANQQFCLDYYSIDSHDMDVNYWEDVGDNGDSFAYGESGAGTNNFYIDYETSHTLGVDWYENKFEPGGWVEYGAHNTQHITANRKAFAMWWILARIAGWSGYDEIPVTGIQINSEGGASQLQIGQILQFSAVVSPANATNTDVVWSVSNGTGSATISEGGLLEAGNPGTVSVVATAMDGSGVSGSLQVIISEESILVTGIQVSAESGATEIQTGLTLQFSAVVTPANATNTDVVWGVSPGTGTASINQLGLLTAGTPGTVTILAGALDGSGVFGNMQLIINSVTTISVTGITVSSAGNITEIVQGSTLQFSAAVNPSDATNSAVIWSVIPGTGVATITIEGELSAVAAGTADVVATAQDGSGVTGSFALTITTPSSGLEKFESGKMILYPNPGSGVIHLDAGNHSIDLIKVVGADGSLWLDKIPESKANRISLDLTGQSPGPCFVKIISGREFVVKLLIISD